MTQEFLMMLELFKNASHGTNKQINVHCDVLELRDMALRHGVYPIIFNQYINAFKNDNINANAKNIIENDQNSIIQLICKDIQQKEMLRQMFCRCRELGIECVLLKGYIFANLYTDSDYRISGDIDLYINPKDEDEMINILQEQGFSCVERLNTEYHRECFHPRFGILELHISLYDNYVKNIWLKSEISDITESFVEVKTKDGYKYTTLGYSDNYIFIVLHFIKHFISGGVGVRQLMDIMLFAKKYKDNINRDRYVETMIKLKFDTLMDVMTAIAVEYLGFSYDDLIMCNSNTPNHLMTEKILNIIEKGGLFGKGTEGLQNFSKKYTQILLQKNSNRKCNYNIEKIKNNGIISSIFLKPDQLSERYGYAKRNRLLLPIAWMHRIVYTIIDSRTVHSKTTQAEDDRLNLLKELNIL